ncbi:MAG: ferritin-like domain-containing protein [Pseudomonadota bacterium]|nr:ferritin-like domain-containing protein [Pseudomonadota bacterium]
MKHWRIDDVSWGYFDPNKTDPELVSLVKSAAMVERNGIEYAIYLKRVFHDDPDFSRAADNWANEEVQHGDALGRWAMLADPSWDYPAAFRRYQDGFKLPLDAEASVRGSRSGELIARCMVETGTSSYYTAVADATQEPVLQQICRLIAADEFRHFKLFYDHLRRYLRRENISLWRRVRIALGRVTESEDDELAFAWHCGSDPVGTAYEHRRCTAACLSRALDLYRFRHIERSMGMIFKAIGLPPRGRLSELAARLGWQLLKWRRRRLARSAAAPATGSAGALPALVPSPSG